MNVTIKNLHYNWYAFLPFQNSYISNFPRRVRSWTNLVCLRLYVHISLPAPALGRVLTDPPEKIPMAALPCKLTTLQIASHATPGSISCVTDNMDEETN